MNYIIVGPQGSGKTRLAALIATGLLAGYSAGSSLKSLSVKDLVGAFPKVTPSTAVVIVEGPDLDGLAILNELAASPSMLLHRRGRPSVTMPVPDLVVTTCEDASAADPRRFTIIRLGAA